MSRTGKRALGLELDFAERRGLHGGDERSSRNIPLETAELLLGDDDDAIVAVHGHVLWSLAAFATHDFAQARLGFMEDPVASTRYRLASTLCTTGGR
jgi:hypothetical protein